MACPARWQGQTCTIGGAIPAGLTTQDVTKVNAYNIDAELDDFVRLAVP